MADAIEALSKGDFLTARIHLSKARALNAKVWRRQIRLSRLSNAEWAKQQGADPDVSQQLLNLTIHIRASWLAVANWLDIFITSVGRDQLLKSSDGIDILLDRYLPFHWDVNQDIAVLSGKNTADFLNALLRKGQKYVLVVEESKSEVRDCVERLLIPEGAERSEGQLATVLKVNLGAVVSDEQLKALQSLEPPGYVSITTDASGEEFAGFEALKNQISAAFITGRSARFWPTIFCEQVIKNLPHIYWLHSVTDLRSHLAGKHVLVVSPGPSLRDSVSAIKAHQESFIVVSLLRSLPILLDEGIIPDFAILVDAQDHTTERLNLIPQDLRVGSIPLILPDYAHRSGFESSFREFFVLPTSALVGSPISVALHGSDAPLALGTSVATTSVSLFAELGSRSISVIGQDLSVSESGEAYASSDQKALKTADNVTCIGIDGEQLRTQEDYLQFISEFSNIGMKYAQTEIALFNCTSRGAYLDNWDHLPLNNQHPAVMENTNASLSSLGTSVNKVEKKLRSNRKDKIKIAIDRELVQLSHIEVINHSIVGELHALLSESSADTSFLDALENELLSAMRTEGSIIKFYTSPAKFEATASLQSNQDIKENFIVSLDYYLAISAGASRLRHLFLEAQEKIEAQI